MNLVWARPAWEDRKTIREFIAADNPRAAVQLDDLISENALRWVDHPGLGRPGRVPGTRELVAHKNYILIYDLVGDGVRILRVLHATRQWPPASAPMLPAREDQDIES